MSESALVRYPLTALAGLIFAALLFWLLQFLISSGLGVFEVKQAVKIDFTPLRQDTEIESKRDKVEPIRPQQVPQIPQMNTAASGSPGEGINLAAPSVSVEGIGGVEISAGSDRDVMPLVRVPPDYPRRAAERGIEGWVLVEFSITPQGTTSNARVIDASPKNIFDDAALKAIARYKYNPRVVEGVAVDQPGIRLRIRFELEEAR